MWREMLEIGGIAWINEYLRGVRDHWTMDQWRAAIDAAMKGEGDA